jgi:hypothetical protein
MNNRKHEKRYKHVEIESSLAHKAKMLAVQLDIEQRIVQSAIFEFVLCDEELKKKFVEKMEGKNDKAKIA